MRDVMLNSISPLAGMSEPHPPDGAAGVVITERSVVPVAYLLVHAGCAAQFGAAMTAAFGIVLPANARRVVAGDMVFIWAGPDRWLAVAEVDSGAAAGAGADDSASLTQQLIANLESVFAGSAAVSRQSGAQVIVSLGGPQVRQVLAKLCPLDLHPAAFGPDAVALTKLAQVAVQLWRPGTADEFEIALPRSYARYLWAAMVGAGTEYGCAVGERR